MAVVSHDERIFQLFKYAQNSFSHYGVIINWPADTDPYDTYHWRYIENLNNYLTELKVDDVHIPIIIDGMVHYASQSKRLSRGLSILATKDLVTYGLQYLEQHLERTISVERSIGDSLGRLRALSASYDQVGTLLRRANCRALPNIIVWYQSGVIADVYLAISRSCRATLRRLGKLERSLLPGEPYLYAMYDRCRPFKRSLRALLGSDWQEC